MFGVSLATISLLGAALLWGSSFVAMKVAVSEFHPLFMVFCRMTLATATLSLFAGRFRTIRYYKGDWKWMLIMGICEPGLYFVFEAYALQNTSASQAGMVAATLPVMVTAGAAMLLAERNGRTFWSGLVMAVIGVVVLSAAADATDHAPAPLLGNILEFCAMCAATVYMLIMKRLFNRYPPLFLTAVQACVGMFFFLPLIFLPATTWPESFAALDPVATLCVVFLGVVVTLGGYGLYNFGMSRVSAAKASVFINLIPAVAVVMGWLLLDERLNAIQLGGCALVFAGVFVSQREKEPAIE